MIKAGDKVNLYFSNGSGVVKETNRIVTDYHDGLLEIRYQTEEKSRLTFKKEIINLASKSFIRAEVVNH